jgi:cytochrome c oxidase assembly protein subunit 15
MPNPIPSNPARPPARRLAWACVALLLAVTTVSAFIRLSRAGIDCEPWPRCHLQRAGMTATALDALDTPAITAARMAHRALASAALLLIVFLLMKTLAEQKKRALPLLSEPGLLASGLLALALFLAVLGGMTGGSNAPAVTLGNLLGGFVMLGLSARLALAPESPRPGRLAARRPSPWRALWGVTLALLLAQAALGAYVSATQASTGCGQWGLCRWHTLAAGPLAAALLALAWRAWRDGAGPAAAAGVTALVLQIVLGLLQAELAPSPLPLALAHNFMAALLVAAAVALAPAPRG